MDNTLMRITNNFIDWGNQNGAAMSPLKLQKLIYLYYARYYHLQGTLPFDDCFEKWPKGPVLRDLYETLKIFGGNAIAEPLLDVRGKIITFTVGVEPFNTPFQETACRYGLKTGGELVRLTHEGLSGVDHRTAWAKAPELGDMLRLDDVREDGRYFFA